MILISYVFLCFIVFKNYIGCEDDSFLSFTNFYKKYHVIGDETKQLRVSNKINLYNLLTEYKLKRKFV